MLSTMETTQHGESLNHCDAFPNFKSDINGQNFPPGTTPLESQVAGHRFDFNAEKIGVLRKSPGRILKAINNDTLGDREIAFYESLQSTQDRTLLELKRYAPKYYGTAELEILNKRMKFIELKDITEGMGEPCVIDIKIGKRTWDPLATPEKRAYEERKYAESKDTYGFCIPGFQVYRLSTGNLRKYGKDFGKKLNADTVVEALEIFLNASPGRPPNRQLLMKLLSLLWKILAFFRSQKKLRFYSSSLLIAYDARRLRHCLRKSMSFEDNHFSYPPLSLRSNTFSSFGNIGNPLSGNKNTPIYKPQKSLPCTPLSAAIVRIHRAKFFDKSYLLKRSVSLSAGYEFTEKDKHSDRFGSCGTVDKLCRTHSFSNNFDDDIVKMKEDYYTILHELSSSLEVKENWVRVNMIDFTHVFPAENSNSLDTNYLQGIENLIKLLETFLT